MGEYRVLAHSICNLKYSVPKKITIVFHNGPNYGHHFINKELAEGFQAKFNCLGEYVKKIISSVPIEKKS